MDRSVFRFTGQIWQVRTSLDGNFRVVELKDRDQKSTVFSVIDSNSEDKLWEKSLEGLERWSTLVGVGTTHFFVHNYRNPEIPEPSDLLAFDIQSGNLSWVLPNFHFRALLGDKLLEVATRTGLTVEAQLVDVVTGRVIAESVDNQMFKVFNEVFPTYYQKGDPYFDTIVGFINSHLNIGDIHAVEYAELSPYLIISYYFYKGQKLVLYLVIIDRWHKVQHHQEIEISNNFVGKDTFSIVNGQLIFVNSDKELNVIKLVN